MKLLLLLLGIAAFAGYILPGRIEVTASPCTALDARAGRLLDAAVGKSAPRAPGSLSALLGEAVRSHVPFLPAEIACATAYWVTVYQPDLGKLAPGAIPPGG
jgi:hypothetical protein